MLFWLNNKNNEKMQEDTGPEAPMVMRTLREQVLEIKIEQIFDPPTQRRAYK